MGLRTNVLVAMSVAVVGSLVALVGAVEGYPPSGKAEILTFKMYRIPNRTPVMAVRPPKK